MIDKRTRDKIVAQSLKEIDFARQYKLGIIWRWQRNEDMYYARKLGTPAIGSKDAVQRPEPDARVNVTVRAAATC